MGTRTLLRPKLLLPLSVFVFFSFQVHFFTSYNNKLVVEKISGSNNDKVFVNDKNYIASPYERLLSRHKDDFHALDYHQKCLSYFTELYKTESSWELTDFKELPYQRYIFESKDKFIQERLDKFFNSDPERKKMSNEERDKLIAEKDLKKLHEMEWTKVVESSRITEQRLVDSSTHLRVYGACFLDQYGQFNKISKSVPSDSELKTINDQCHDIELRMFQWLSRRSPVFTRWDRQVFPHMPIMSDFIDQPDLPEYEDTHSLIKNCYLKSLRNSYNGKGITISAADKHVDQLISLFGLLRALGNKLPIQIVHSGDLSVKAQEILTKACRNLDDLDVSKIENLDFAIKQRNITISKKDPYSQRYNETELAQLFPPQELWFVDVSNSITKEYRGKFSGYGNKLLAYFFNSFQHSILIDTDTVPVVDLDKFIFKSTFYQDKGAYFFKDRELYKQNSRSDEILYTKLMPSTIDQALFGIPEITDFTLNNRFIGGRFAHLMESGVVAIDKIRHFTGILATLQILMWAPAASKVWGDKELFWLGMSMAGDEDYYLNHWPAGSAGQITPRNRRLIDDKDDTRRSKLIGNELCSTHPAHLSSEDNSTLLWFNSGFTFCKFLDASEDDHVKFPLTRNLFNSAAELKNMYNSYQKIDAVIIPAAAEHYVDGRAKGENSRGWEKMDVCRGFIWCAYDRVGGVDDPKSNGLMIQFDEDTRKMYSFYGYTSQYAPEIFKVEKKK